MNKYSVISMMCASFLIIGCDHYSTKMLAMNDSHNEMAQITPATGEDLTFKQHLAREYYQRAAQEHNVTNDYRAAKSCFEKMERLNEFQMVPLEDYTDKDIPESEKRELALAKEELFHALNEYRYPENRAPLAKAYSRYDCWIDEAEEGKEPNTCKAEFKEAMSNVVYPVVYTEEDDAYFDDVFDLAL